MPRVTKRWMTSRRRAPRKSGGKRMTPASARVPVHDTSEKAKGALEGASLTLIRRSTGRAPEPLVGFEPTTARLRIECSTPELQWRRFQPCPGADSNRDAFRHHPLKMACLPVSPPGRLTHQLTASTGPTGLEPATSRVTVECSNQTELRPLARIGGSRGAPTPPPNPISCTCTACHRGIRLRSVVTHHSRPTTHHSRPTHPPAHASNTSLRPIARRGIEPLSAP